MNMKDIKVISIRTSLPISFPVTKISDNPLTLEIRGSGFLRAKYVYLNDFFITTFSIISDQLITVEVPSILAQKDIKRIQVLSDSPVVNKKNALYFEMPDTIQSVEGFQRTIQHFVKLLMQTPGSNAFNINEGGGLLQIIGKNTVNEGVSVTTDVIDGINRTKEIIIAKQNKLKNIPLNERLMTVTINAVSIKNKTDLLIELTLTNMSGTSLNASLSL